jgi:FkbM family methyltransferase
MRARERFAPRRMALVAKDLARRAGMPTDRLRERVRDAAAPRATFRRSMSRSTPARGSRHRWLQERYRARRIRQFLSPVVRKGQLAFDVGANVGEWSAVMRGLGASVVAVEPQADCVTAMEARFAGDVEFEIVKAAVADWVGTGSLRPTTTSSEHASMSGIWQARAAEKGYLPAEVWLEPVEVPVLTLDSLIANYGAPSFCKIDVEGFEPEALRGLGRSVPALAFEFHAELLGAVDACLDRLAELAEYRYRVFVGEWPDPHGGELPPEMVASSIARIEPGSWGMIRASRVEVRAA